MNDRVTFDTAQLDSPAAPRIAPVTSATPEKGPFPAPAPVPTLKAPHGIRFDFNLGCRIVVPAGDWRVRLSDLDTGNVLFETTIGAGAVTSAKKYFVRFRVEIWDRSQGGGQSVLNHDYDAKGKPVLIQFPIGTLGDIIGWFPYAVKFQQLHDCQLTCAMSPLLIPIFEEAYPQIEFITPDEVKAER